MRLHVLGCSGSDLPGYRLTSFLVNDSILLDAGAVTSSLSLDRQSQIHDILVTHAHLDHIKDILFLADNLIELVARDAHGPVRVRGLKMEDLAILSKHLTPRLLRRELDKLKASPKIYISHMKSPFSTMIQEQLQEQLVGYSYHLLRDGEDLVF